jgi:hypothetical protein
MAVPDTFYELTLVWQAITSIREYTSSFGAADLSVSPRTATQMASDVYDDLTAGGAPCAAGSMMDDYRFLGVHCALGTPTGDILGQRLATITGSVSDACPPSNCALLVNKSTALGGRRYRGRMFVPVAQINEGAVDSVGVVSGSTLTAAATAWNTAYTNLVADDVIPHLFHQGGGAPVPTVVTAFTVQTQLATQRRRMRS